MAGVIPKKAADAILQHCGICKSKRAVRIADELMELPEVRPHGPEHHLLVAAAILTAYCNFYDIEKKSLLLKAYVRTNNIPVGTCAMYGCCGALMGAGAAVGLLLSVHPFSGEDLQTVNKITAGIQARLAEYGGPRCCKRAAWISVYEAVQGINQYMHCKLPAETFDCGYSLENKDCLKKKCEFFVHTATQCRC